MTTRKTAAKGPDGLTPRQKEYARRVANGESQAAAYVAAGYSDGNTGHGREVNANRLANTEKVLKEVQRLRAAAERGATLDRAARQALLAEIATSPDERTRDRLTAADLLCKMSGDYSAGADIRVTVATETERRDAWRAALNGPETPQE